MDPKILLEQIAAKHAAARRKKNWPGGSKYDGKPPTPQDYTAAQVTLDEMIDAWDASARAANDHILLDDGIDTQALVRANPYVGAR